MILNIMAIIIALGAYFGLTYGLLALFLGMSNSLALKSALIAVLAQCLIVACHTGYELLKAEHHAKKGGAK